MSDVMLFGVLRMPYQMAMGGELSRRQFYDRVQEAADRLEAAEKQLAELESAAPPSPSTANEKLLTIIAYAYQIAGAHDAPDHILDVLADPEEATDAQIDAMLPYQPSTASEVGELPPLPMTLVKINQDEDGNWGEIQPHAWDSVYAFELDVDAPLFTSEQMRDYARAALAAKPAAREVSQQGQLLCDSALRAEPAGRVFSAIADLTDDEIQSICFRVVTSAFIADDGDVDYLRYDAAVVRAVATELAARSRAEGGNTQPSTGEVDAEAERKDAERYRWVCAHPSEALPDTLADILLAGGRPSKVDIDRAIDAAISATQKGE